MVNCNLLAVSIGNTRTRVGAFVAGKLVETAVFDNGRDGEIGDAMEHAFAPLRERKDAVVLLSSTNPAGTRKIEQQIEKHLHFPIRRVEKDVTIPIGRQLDPEAIVGEDRLLNAAAAYDVLKQGCVVIDAGTAITVDFVDGAGTFHGGAIAPGAQLMLDALSGRIRHLPDVELQKPQEPIGHNTVQAMITGVYYGIRGMVRELVEQYATVAGSFPTVVATGGDANMLFRECELVDRIVPDLTLMGLHVTLRTAMDQSRDKRAE
jgi:type III pantothenate kinase